MALTDLPPVPSARPGDAAVQAALAAGVTLQDAFPSLYSADRGADEALRQVVAALREGLLTLDQAVSDLLGAGGGAPGAGVEQVREDLETLTARVNALPATTGGGGLSTQQLAQALAPYAPLADPDFTGDVTINGKPLVNADSAVAQFQTELEKKYTLPAGGLDVDDVSSTILASLGRADAALQVVTTRAEYDALPPGTAAIILDEPGDTPYVLPAGGVPEKDLDPAVVAKLGAGGGGGAVADGSLAIAKLAPALASRVEVPRFVPQDQTALLGLPTAYVRESSVTITKAMTGLSTIYWPYLVKVPDAEFARLPQYGRWRLYCSTDHDSGSGGIGVLKTDAERPGDAGAVWTSLRPNGGAKIFTRGSGDQVETPTVVYNPLATTAQDQWRMYYQIQAAKIGDVTPQYTGVANSPDGITGWQNLAGGILTPDQGWLGWRHTGYARMWLVDGRWVSWQLSGGGDFSSYGWAYSNDGISWVLDKRRILSAAAWGGGLGRLGISTLMRYRGGLWAIGRVSGYSSGTTTSASSLQFMTAMRPDLLGPAGQLQPMRFVDDAGQVVADPPSWGPCFAADSAGSLWTAYRTGDSNSSFRFMEVK